MKCLLFCNRQKLADKSFPRNDGIDGVMLKPETFCYDGNPLQLVDTAPMTSRVRKIAYLKKAMWPSVARPYEVEAMFGSGTYGGILFGGDVPALIIESDSGEVLDVYPHRESKREITIREVLTESWALQARSFSPTRRSTSYATISPSSTASSGPHRIPRVVND